MIFESLTAIFNVHTIICKSLKFVTSLYYNCNLFGLQYQVFYEFWQFFLNLLSASAKQERPLQPAKNSLPSWVKTYISFRASLASFLLGIALGKLLLASPPPKP